jgi:hypothetical protein
MAESPLKGKVYQQYKGSLKKPPVMEAFKKPYFLIRLVMEQEILQVPLIPWCVHAQLQDV